MPFQQQAASQLMNIPNVMDQNTHMPYAPFVNNSHIFQQQGPNQFYNQLQANSNINVQNASYLYSSNSNIQPGMLQNINSVNSVIRNQQQPQQFQSVINSVPQSQLSANQTFSKNHQVVAETPVNTPPLKHLQCAFRIGINGLEALPKRIDGANQVKYRQMPSYSDDVKWLWKLAVRLGK